MIPKLYVGGIDLTEFWQADRSSIISPITKQIDTATFFVEDIPGDFPYEFPILLPASSSVFEMDEVICRNSGDTERYFGGFVSVKSLDTLGICPVYQLSCVDYTLLLETAIVNEVYENMSDRRIIEEALIGYRPEMLVPQYDHLVGWWRFTEGSGAELADSSKEGNDGTISGASWVVDGHKPGFALDFDGSNDSVLTPSLAYSPTALSCFWWQKQSQWVSGIDTSVYFNGGNYVTWVAIGGTHGLLVTLSTGGYKDIRFNSTEVYDRWAFCGFTFDNGIIKQYVNGELARTDDFSPDQISVSTLRIGGRSGAYYFDGLIDEVMVFDVALTADEIKWLYDLGANWSINEGKTIDKYIANRIPIRQILDELASVSGFDWYVDYYKRLHYFEKGGESAPFSLSDDPDNVDSFPYILDSYAKDATKIANRVRVRGGTYKSDDTDFELSGNGQTTEILLPYKLTKPSSETAIQVYVNDGDDSTPSWTSKTVGADNLNTFEEGYDVLYNYQEKLLKFNSAPPDLKRSVKVTGQYDVPIDVRVRSETSYTTYNNRWFDETVEDEDIGSTALAKLKGKAVLAENAFSKEQGAVTTTKDGLVSGMLVPITHSILGIDDSYVVNTLETTFKGGELAQYKVQFGAYNPDLIDMMLTLKRKTKQLESREGEVINELLEVFESLSFSDEVSATATGPSYYCSPASGENDPIICGFWKCAA